MKKTISLILSLVLVVSMLAACAGITATASAEKKVELTFMTNVVGEKANALETAIKDFEAETGYIVEFSAPGSSYEELMKTKMSSNSLPDVFTTHGWSVARYSEYLMPVNEMPFASRISDQIKPVITNADGEMFVLPIDIDIAGIVYNVDVLDQCSIDVDSIKTWADFAEACETVRAAGIDPISIGGKDNWTIGGFFDWVAPSFYITNEATSKATELKSGEFDTDVWTQIAQMMADWTAAGYFNTDVLTADYDAEIEALATGKAAFCFNGNSTIADAKAKNADANLGMMPIPSNDVADEPSLIAGEDIAIGIWKDTEYAKEAQELLEYLARPEVCSKIATAAGSAAGLTDADADLGEIKPYIDKHSNVGTYPYFDREYLPSGLWDVMCSTGAEILAQNTDAVDNAAKVMLENFNDKFVG